MNDRRLIVNEWNEKIDCNVSYSVTGKVMKYPKGVLVLSIYSGGMSLNTNVRSIPCFFLYTLAT